MSGPALPRRQVLIGDARQRLAELPDASVDCVITSPPYFGLRDYGHDGQLGAERHIDEWVKGLLDVCRELARVLKPTGALWLNLGDGQPPSERRHAEEESAARPGTGGAGAGRRGLAAAQQGHLGQDQPHAVQCR